MATLMGTTVRYVAESELEKEALVSELKEKHGDKIKQLNIVKRQRREFEFFIVTLVLEICTIKELFSEV